MASSPPDRIVSFRLPLDLVRRLEHIARHEDRSLSAVLRLAATRYVVQAEREADR
jgi:predicted transcriptional regulator